MASTRFLLRRMAARRSGDAQSLLVNRTMGLAGIDDAAAGSGVKIGDGSGTIDKLITALDDDIGISADHWQRALAHPLDELTDNPAGSRPRRWQGRSRPRSPLFPRSARGALRPSNSPMSRSGPI